jgi:hypothetical protein
LTEPVGIVSYRHRIEPQMGLFYRSILTNKTRYNMKKTILLTAATVALFSFNASAETLVEVDFSGSGGITTIASANSQFTVKNSAVTFDDTADTLAAVGGSTGVGGWNYD